MTIGGALSELNNLLKADDIPVYYKPSIKAVIDTIALSSSEKPNKWVGADVLNHWIGAELLDKIRADIDSYCSDNRDRNDGLYIAMRIIDKYQASLTVAEGSDKE